MDHKICPTSKFHGVGQNLFKAFSILSNGIVTKNYTTYFSVPAYSSNYSGYNGDKYISLSKLGTPAFNTFSGNGISFLIDDSIYAIDANKTDHDSGIPGEVFCTQGIIKPSEIKAVVCPENLLNTNLKDLRLFENCGTGYVNAIAQNVLNLMHYDENSAEAVAINELVKKKEQIIQSNLELVNKLKYERSVIDEIDAYLGELTHKFFCEKLNKDELCIRDVMLEMSEKYNIDILTFDENYKFNMLYTKSKEDEPTIC